MYIYPVTQEFDPMVDVDIELESICQHRTNKLVW